jgi:hypothetical protein
MEPARKDPGIDSSETDTAQPDEPTRQMGKENIASSSQENPTHDVPVTIRMKEKNSLFLELPGASRQYQVRSGDIIGQEHLSSRAQIQISGIEGGNFIHRHHCQFEYIDGEWYVTPLLQSQSDFVNPSSLNIQRLQPGHSYKITNGDKLTLGRITFLIRIF